MRGSGLFNNGGQVNFEAEASFGRNGDQDSIWNENDVVDRSILDHGYGGAIYNDDEGVIT